MPLSPSMYVIALRHDAVLSKAGSKLRSPKSSSDTFICRRSIALMAPSATGMLYFRPVLLSMTVRSSEGIRDPLQCSSQYVAVAQPAGARRPQRRRHIAYTVAWTMATAPRRRVGRRYNARALYRCGESDVRPGQHRSRPNRFQSAGGYPHPRAPQGRPARLRDGTLSTPTTAPPRSTTRWTT